MSLELLTLGNVPIPQMVERAKLAEANGYDALWVADERSRLGAGTSRADEAVVGGPAPAVTG